MKVYSFFIVLILFVCSANVFSQVYNAGLDLYVNTTTGNYLNRSSDALVDNMIRQNQQQIQNNIDFTNMMMMNQLLLNAAKENVGRAKLKAGQVTTRITFAPANSIIADIATSDLSSDEKKTKREVSVWALQAFSEAAKAKNLVPNDIADGNALMFVLNYLVYKNEDPGNVRLQKLRRVYKQMLTKDLIFQGEPDRDKQKRYEARIINTMLGVKFYQALKNPSLPAKEKLVAQRMAKDYAESVLKQIWSEPVSGLELSDNEYGFADKGERLTKSRLGSTTFNRTEESTWAQKNAVCYEKNGYTVKEGDTSCFYQMRKQFDAAIKEVGGSTNDLAYANAVAFKLLYEVYTKGQVKLNHKQFEWVLVEMEKDIKTSAGYQSMSDEEKQDDFDSIVGRAMSVYNRYQDDVAYSNDPETLKAASAGATAFAEGKLRQDSTSAYYLLLDIFKPRDLDAYELQSDGFVKVK